jgi:hypothetical protein
MPGQNSAQRVFSHLSRASAISGALGMVDGFTKLFQLPASQDALEASRAVAQRMELLLRQVDATVRACVSRGVPEGLYSRQVSQVRNALNPTALSSKFDHARGHVTPDTLLAFAWAAYVLPAEEGVFIDATALKDLIGRLHEVRFDSLLDSLPDNLRALVTKHLDALLHAFAEYEVTGAAPLEQAVMNFATDAATFDPAIVAEVSKAPEETRSYWTKVKGVLGGAVAAASASGKAAEGVERVLKLAKESGLIEWGKKQIGL